MRNIQSIEQEIELKMLKELFQRSADVIFQSFTFQQQHVYFITCESMVDQFLLNKVIIDRVQSLFEDSSVNLLEEKIKNDLHIPNLQKVTILDDAITRVYSGFVLLYFEGEKILFSSKITKKPNRNPEETKQELVVKGPRDDFIEDVFINVALIRKRLPTNSLCVETVEVGKRSKTTVAVLYMGDITDKNMVTELKKQLRKINTDVVFSGDIMMESVEKTAKILPRHDYTGRPDFAIQALVRGRILLFVDGVSYAIITPPNMFLLFKSGEDNDYPSMVGTLERLLRIVGILISMLLPGFWLALTTYHQEQMPILLLATVVQSRTGLPFPTILEILLMLFMFEIFREANLRLPSILSGTMSVVGGLIIGDAAIKAGITSPSMIVVIAISSIAAYTLVNQSFVTAMSIFRLFVISMAAFFGLFGFFLSLFFILIYFANIRVLSVPYLNIGANLNWSDTKKTLIRLSPKGYSKRPKFLHPQDETRSSGKN
ncbi:spore germination protein [Lysinibacillus varians]|uniref:Spore germination protein n=1 Tax=Lysinibacillus varians TaxID=1145276 RepID=A0ABY2TFN4_9BACI|nr:spore germination protein [Lysinibacillus varians]AHN21393.1 spore germination protein [Lysinibacillus varians]TKI67163.1 spore germination protein [Lysinibacillus varians]